MKITGATQPNKITMTTKVAKDQSKAYQWWKAGSDKELCNQVLATASYLKETQNYRYRQAAIYARLYGNVSLFNYIGSNLSTLNQSQNLPQDRPTFNLVQSATDTLISRIAQNRPAPVFLTDNSDYKQRNLAKKLNNFILGELYQTKAYEKVSIMLRDALVEGTGILKVYQTQDNKVGLDRVLLTELLVDPNEAMHGEPRQMHQLKLVDRAVLMEQAPKYKKIIEMAEKAYPNSGADASKTVSDLVMVVESWHLPSGKDAKDGRHVISCTTGVILDEEYEKEAFPFVFLHYSPRLLGFWSQGLAEQLMGTQLEINSLLYQISRSMKLVGIPMVWVEEGSKVVKAHLNNEIGRITTYRGIKPIYEVPQCVPQELYAQLQRLINYGYQQCGVSALQAGGEKPAGLDSGEAQRVYDNIATDRFNSLSRKYDNVFIELSYQIMDKAIDIYKEEGKYQTVYPNKNSAKEIDFPKAAILLKDTFVIQCFNTSSLPRDPAGRLAKVTEMIQAGMVSIKEGRRLLDYPDLDQMETLANASEERIFKILDEIVEEGKYTPPDPFMDLQLANELVVQYYNLYAAANLEEEKQELLRNFHSQIGAMMQAAQPTPPPGAGAPTPQATPMPLPSSPLVPNAVMPGAA